MAVRTEHRAGQWSLSWPALLIGLIVGVIVGFAVGHLRSHQGLLTSKLLDWPFLTFVLLLLFVISFYSAIRAALSRGELTIGWGKDQSIKISNLGSEISGELDPLKEDIEGLKKAVRSLEIEVGVAGTVEGLQAAGAPPVEEAATTMTQGMSLRDIRLLRLRELLSSPKYMWRSVDRLAKAIAMSETDTQELLVAMDDVRLSRGISGNQIAGLRSRVGSK